MPAGDRTRGRKQFATGTRASSVVQNTETEPEPPYRPRTRAWAKQQGNVAENSKEDTAGGPDQPHRPHTRAWAKQQDKDEKNAKDTTAGRPAQPHRPRKGAPERQQQKVQKKVYEKVKRKSKKHVRPRVDQPRRPGTRAWIKAQGEGERQKTSTPQILQLEASPSLSNRKPPAIELRPQPRQSDRSHQHFGSETPPQVLKSARTGKDTRNRFNSKASAEAPNQTPENPFNRPQTRSAVNHNSLVRTDSGNQQTSGLARWLSRVESVSPGRTARARALYTARVPGIPPEEEGSMHESSSSVTTGENASTAKAKGSRATKVSASKLRYRRIYEDPTADEKLEYLESIIKTTLPELPNKEIGDLQSAAQTFIDETRNHPRDNCYSFIDNFSFNFDKAKSEINYPFINERYFNSDLKRCLAGNEAVLQRTIMIHIINQYWLGGFFDWNSEGSWSQPEDSRLPSSKADTISSPKPDLAMFFTLKSFTGEAIDDPIPTDLEQCISPDGGKRCFPFLFMEVKKAGADLQDAYTANLHSASQALYNIYIWMVRSGHEEMFYNDVRVFSLVFNAQDLSVRVHRAEARENGTIYFLFDELLPLQRYTKDQACLLIKTTVAGYAAKELHPLLKSVFKEVTKQESEQAMAVLAKRKANAQSNPSAKRARRQGSLPHTGQSFLMSTLNTG